MTLNTNQPPIHEGGCFRGRQSGRKCGDVDESMSDYGMSSKVRYYQLRYYVAKIKFKMTQFQGGQSTQLTVND